MRWRGGWRQGGDKNTEDTRNTGGFTGWGDNPQVYRGGEGKELFLAKISGGASH